MQHLVLYYEKRDTIIMESSLDQSDRGKKALLYKLWRQDIIASCLLEKPVENWSALWVSDDDDDSVCSFE